MLAASSGRPEGCPLQMKMSGFGSGRSATKAALRSPSPERRGRIGALWPRRKSASAEVFVEVDDLGALLKAEQDVEVGALAAVERDRFLNVVGDPGAFLGALEDDADR